MTDDEIKDALDATGHCLECEGEGCTYGDVNDPQEYRCTHCRGTRREPLALLRAVQAVGLLLLKASEKRAPKRAKKVIP